MPLVELMYQRKNFTSDLTQKTAILVGLYMFGLLPLILGRVLTRAFLVLEDTWTPFWVGNIRTVVNLVANFFFIKFFGYPGIAVSTSVTSFVLFAFMYAKLKSKIRIKGSLELFLNFSKMILSGVVAAFFVHVVYFSFFLSILSGFGRFLSVFVGMAISSALGVLVYVCFGLLLKISIIGEAKKVIHRMVPFKLFN
jgi:putative peptidoglycan lipid II flippase